jgi:kumamolisin
MSDVPSGYVRLEKAPNSQLVGPADTNEVISVIVRVRRGSDAPALPDMSDLASTPGSSRQYMSREEFANRYGAAPDDLKKITDFAKAAGLTVVETSAARRTVVLSGRLIRVPLELANIVEGVFGLDNRRMARPAM